MGKSSSQVVGYRYYAKFAAFIGNRIEKLIAINFDSRGWQIGKTVGASQGTDYMYIKKPGLYGENEGGVSGIVTIKTGEPNQTVACELVGRNGDLASAYPYQSYLTFSADLESLFGGINPELMLEEDLLDLTNLYDGSAGSNIGFYLGNSGYMKEMLLWVKRIHVKNNGDVQWYDEKAEIGHGVQRYFQSDKYRQVEVEFTGTCSWSDPSGAYSVPWPAKSFPFVENGQSYYYDFDYENMEVVHINKFPRSPTTTDDAVITMVNKHGMDLAGENSTEVAPLEWIGGTPMSDTMWGGAVVRSFNYNGSFYWGGGIFDAKVVSTNGALVRIKKSGAADWMYAQKIDGAEKIDVSRYYIDAEAGFYEINVSIGGRYPSFSGDYPPRPYSQMYARAEYSAQGEYSDINPIHKIREILTDDTAMAKPAAYINDVNFKKAADRIWSEGLGISWAIDEKSCLDAIEELCYHIEAGVRVNRQTGLYEMVLFRDNWFKESEIHEITENMIKDLSLEIMNSDDVINQLNVTYYDRNRIKNSTFSVYENGSILTIGKANAESIDFPYFMNMRNAEIVANWKLKQYSTPAWKGEFTTGWREARKWNRYDLVKINWSKKWQGTILARIMLIDLGDGRDNTVRIEFEEVVPYSGEMNTSIVVDDPINDVPQPPQPAPHEIFEAPYYLTVLKSGQTSVDAELSNNPNIGYVVAIAAKPQNNSLNALLYTDGGMGEFEKVSRLDYCDILQLDQPIIETTSSFTVTGSLTQAANSNNFILLNNELMGFVSFDSVTKVLTVKRGVLDTVPKKHSSGRLFVFDLPDVAFDSTQYAQSEIVEAQVLTTTPSGVQELNESGTPVEIQSRAIRPYPPANVKINSAFMPSYFEDDLLITWSDRNRLQQTGGAPLGYFESSVTLEPNTQTLLTVVELDENQVELATHSVNVTASNSYTLLESAMQAETRSLHINLKTVRDGYECLHVFDHTAIRSTLIAPTNVTFEVIEY